MIFAMQIARKIVIMYVVNKMKRKNFGFTLFELLVVISIIAALVAVVSTSYASAQKRARDATRRQDIKAVQKAIEQYRAVNNKYPAGCNPGDTYLPGGLPSDPKPGQSYSWQCADNSYCICGHLETGGGNAQDTGTAAGCHYGSGDYFCLSNLQ